MSDPSSYTFELTSRSGTNIFTPYGDGPAVSGWRALSDSRITAAVNASVRISWQGTAITVKGTVDSSKGTLAYMLSLDGQPPVQETLDKATIDAQILLSRTNLLPGYHTLVMSSLGAGNLTFQGAQLSISTGATRSVFNSLQT